MSSLSTLLQQYIGHLPSWGVHLSVSYLFPFAYCSWVLKARILKWFAIPFSSGPHFAILWKYNQVLLWRGAPTSKVHKSWNSFPWYWNLLLIKGLAIGGNVSVKTIACVMWKVLIHFGLRETMPCCYENCCKITSFQINMYTHAYTHTLSHAFSYICNLFQGYLYS